LNGAVAHSSRVTRGNNFKLFKQTCSIDVRNFFYSNRIVDAWNSLFSTVLPASSISNFKKKLCEVNVDRFLTIVEWFYSYLYVYFFGIVLYFMCILDVF